MRLRLGCHAASWPSASPQFDLWEWSPSPFIQTAAAGKQLHQYERMATLEATQITLSDNQLIQLQLIKHIREAARKELQPLQKDRAEILRALLPAIGGKMLAKDARQKMHIKKRWIFEEEEENRAIYCKRLSRVRRENWLKFEFN